MTLAEELRLAVLVGDNRCLAFPPVGWAHLTELVRVLEGLDESKGLVNGSTDYYVGEEVPGASFTWTCLMTYLPSMM
jgi:hypothetical protein